MGFVLPGDAEVNESHISVRPYDNVVRLDIPVDDGRVHPVEPLQQRGQLFPQLPASLLAQGALPLDPAGKGLPGQIAAYQIDPVPLPEAVGPQGYMARQGGVELGQQPELLLQILPVRLGDLQDVGGVVAPAAEEPHAAALPLRQAGLRPVDQSNAVGQFQTVHHLLVVLTKILGAAHRSPPSPRERSRSSVSSRVRW